MSWWSDAMAGLKSGAPRTPSQVRIPDERVLDTPPSRPFVAEGDYIVVDVNDLRLDYGRKLWQGFVPSVWVSTTLTYAGRRQDVPVVLGPSTLGAQPEQRPDATLFRNARVLGPVPYRGGTLGVSLALSRVATQNQAARLLQLLESIGSSFDLTGAMTPYLAMGRAVGDGIGALLQLGSQPLVAVQDTIDADSGATGGWYLLADTLPEAPLWVVDGQLHVGADRHGAKPATGFSYVLYSVTALPGGIRNDAAQLPDLRQQREFAEQFAVLPDKRSWTTAKAILADLGIRLRRHPDLTRTQAEHLFAAWGEDLIALHERATAFAHRGPGPEADPLTPELDEVRNIVDQVMRL